MSWDSKTLWLAATLLMLHLIFASGQPRFQREPLPVAWEAFLREGEKFTLYAIQLPMTDKPMGIPREDLTNSRNLILWGKPRGTGEKVEGYPVLGKVQITDQEGRNSLINALTNALDANGLMANCFSPRHAISVSKGTNTLSMIICFECGQAIIKSNDYRRKFAITNEPAELFNATLRKAGVSPAP